jgi:hypothetical protein
MHSKENILKYLYAGLILILFLPWLQEHFEIVKEKKLKGAITKEINPAWNLKVWFEADFQKKKEDYLHDEFGFRTWFIRFHNQLEYWMFKKVHANYVIEGKEQYFYEYNYIKTYFGRDFLGEERIGRVVSNLKKIQDALAAQNKTFVFVMAASKGQFYPEYFPDTCKYSKATSNYEVYARQLKDAGLNFVDFNASFLDNKNSSPYKLYSKYGIHWTTYGAAIAADSILHYIENIRHIDMMEMKWDSIRLETARNDDRDIELGLNLLYPFKQETLAYPVVYYEPEKGKVKPSVMVVADSYYWSLFGVDIFHAFSKNQFWYYYYQIYEAGISGIVTADDKILRKALGEFDVVVLITTDANLYNAGWDFIDAANRVLQNNSNLIEGYDDKIENLKAYIPRDSGWIQSVRLKATQRGITVDSMITLDAVWMVEHGNEKN